MNRPLTPLQTDSPFELGGRTKQIQVQNAGFVWRTILLTLFMLGLLLSYNAAFSQTYCTMICNDYLNVSVGNDCSVTLNYDQIMEDADNSNTCTPNGSQAFKVEVMDEQLKVIPTSPTIPYEYVGRTLTVKVKHWATGNSCWATINLQDKIPPKLECPADVTISCTASTDPEFTGTPNLTDCGSGSTLTYEDIYTYYNCGNPVAQITRIWTAEDSFGNKSQCTQTIHITRPNTLFVQFPPNLDGIAAGAISCLNVNSNPLLTNPEFTGYPTIRIHFK